MLTEVPRFLEFCLAYIERICKENTQKDSVMDAHIANTDADNVS